MLSAKPWKAEAILRLLLSVFVCVFAGSLLASLFHYFGAGGKTSAKLLLPVAGAAMVCLAATLILLSKPWRLEHLAKRLIVLFICFYGGLCLGAWTQELAGASAVENSAGRMVIATLSFQGAALVLVRRTLREHGMSWSEAFGFANHRRQALLAGVILACLFLPLGNGLQRASMALMEHLPRFPIVPKEQQAVLTLRIAVSWVDRATLGVVTILLVPAAEEVLFRGILYPWIKQSGFPRLALWGTSLLFAAIHANLATFLPLFVLAIALALLYEKTNNLLAPITAHASFNALNFVILYLIQKQTS